MAGPIRIEYAGVLYHVTLRGDRREDIYLSDEDRIDWLDGLGQTCKRFDWVSHAYYSGAYTMRENVGMLDLTPIT